METIYLTISGMTCGACVKHVEKAIASIAGVEKVEVDLTSGSAKVQGTVSEKLKELIAVLEEEGYPATAPSDASSQTNAKRGDCKSGNGCCCN